jgi:hypothetical protein
MRKNLAGSSALTYKQEMRHLFLLVSVATFSIFANADLPSLPPFPAAPSNPVNTETKPDPKCDEIVARLEAYTKDIYNHHQSVLSYLDQVGQTAGKWQKLLGPLEKQTVTVPEGYFISLQDNSAAIEQVTAFAYDNSAYFAAELDQIITALKTCQR